MDDSNSEDRPLLDEVETPEEFYGDVVDALGPRPEAPVKIPVTKPSHVDFRNVFKTSFFGSIREASDYSVEGDLPESGSVVFHIHGWRNSESDGKAKIDFMREAYSDLDEEVSGVTWASDDTWWNSKKLAKKVGERFADFLMEYSEEFPDTSLRVQGHSLGARVVAETVLKLYSREENEIINEAVLLGGAVNNYDVAVDGRYGKAFKEATEAVENFYFEEDAVLKWLGLYERSNFVGNSGGKGDTPDNYTDHEIDAGSHGGYYTKEIMQDIIEEL